jgi:hypothetical protein
MHEDATKMGKINSIPAVVQEIITIQWYINIFETHFSITS